VIFIAMPPTAFTATGVAYHALSRGDGPALARSTGRVHRRPKECSMLILAQNWWALGLRGLVGILTGALTLAFPGSALAALVLVFGAYAFVDGAFSVLAALRGARGDRSWWALLLGGLAGMLAGLAAFLVPALTTLVLLYVIAAWALLTGALEIAAAIRLRDYIHEEWLLGLSGALSILFGVLIVIAPAAGALAVALLIGSYVLIAGIVILALALRLRSAISTGQRPRLRRAA
jgi:uncharacterized membrane protein HdeD (DUF308 family)